MISKITKVEREIGLILPLILITMAGGVLIIGPMLSYISTSLYSLQKGNVAINEYYAADSGVEHVVWRIKYNGLLLDFETPFNYIYSSVNGLPIDITVTKIFFGASALCGQNLPPNPTDRAEISRAITPMSAPPGVLTTFDYMISFRDIGTSVLHFNEIGYSLPDGFTYVAGSSTGFTTDDPVIDEETLQWHFPTPMPKINPGEEVIQRFQARGVLNSGTYCGFCDGAWVIFAPEDVGCIMANGGERYNIRTVAGSTYVQTAIGISGADTIIISWDTR